MWNKSQVWTDFALGLSLFSGLALGRAGSAQAGLGPAELTRRSPPTEHKEGGKVAAADPSPQTVQGRNYSCLLAGFGGGSPHLKYQDIKMTEPCCVSVLSTLFSP